MIKFADIVGGQSKEILINFIKFHGWQDENSIDLRISLYLVRICYVKLNGRFVFDLFFITLICENFNPVRLINDRCKSIGYLFVKKIAEQVVIYS